MPLFQQGSALASLKLRYHRLKLTGDVTLKADDPPLQFLDANGANRIVNLPSPADSDGLVFVLMKYEGGTQQIDVRSEGSTVMILAPTAGGSGDAESGIVVCDGQHWIGFRARAQPT